MKIVRDSAVRQEPAQPQAVSPEENRFSIRPRQIALFFLWMLAFTLLARGTSGALLPEVQLSTPAPNTITQSLTATGTIQWAAGSLFYLPEGLLVEAVFVSEGEAVQEGDKIAALRREDVEQMYNIDKPQERRKATGTGGIPPENIRLRRTLTTEYLQLSLCYGVRDRMSIETAGFTGWR